MPENKKLKLAVNMMKFTALDTFEDSCNAIDEEGNIRKLCKVFKKGQKDCVWPELRRKKLERCKLIEVTATQ